jgi:hypothetical protein
MSMTGMDGLSEKRLLKGKEFRDMSFMVHAVTQRAYFYPLANVGKFATRTPEGMTYQGVPRVNKWGQTVTEFFSEGVAGKIVGLRIVPAKEEGLPSQYHLILRDPDDERAEAVLAVSSETSLGRQLINRLLSLTPADLRGVVSFYLRRVEEEGRSKLYLDVYRGRYDVREHRVPAALSGESVPPPQEQYLGDGRKVLDYSETNDFFRARARELQERWRPILTQQGGAVPVSAVNGHYGAAGAAGTGYPGAPADGEEGRAFMPEPPLEPVDVYESDGPVPF